MLHNLIFYLKISRPGLWFSTVWLYMLPTSGNSEIFHSLMFWLGLVYVTLPLNLMVYGWNDMVDRQADRLNPRKGNFLFGGSGNDAELDNIPLSIILLQMLFYPFFIWFGGWKMLGLLLLQIFVLFLYNHPTKGWRSKPPLELTCQAGYLLIVPFSMWLNDGLQLSVWAYVYLVLFATQSHLIGEVMDITPDILAGKHTTATVIGQYKTKLIIICIVAVEIFIITQVFHDMVFGSMLIIASFWLIADLFFIFKNKQYSITQMKFFAIGSNFIAAASIVYVWVSGCLVR